MTGRGEWRGRREGRREREGSGGQGGREGGRSVVAVWRRGNFGRVGHDPQSQSDCGYCSPVQYN